MVGGGGVKVRVTLIPPQILPYVSLPLAGSHYLMYCTKTLLVCQQLEVLP